MSKPTIRIIGSTPPSAGEPRRDFIGRFNDAIQRLDEAGWTSALIYTSNASLDPWVLAHRLIVGTRTLRPLVAVQPIYAHPFTVANQIASLSTLYGRGVDLNFVAGDHPRDREGFNDSLEHDERYARVAEFADIVQALLSSPRPVSRSGTYYAVQNLQIAERPQPGDRPAVLMSGSSGAAQATAKAIGACAIEYPEPPQAVSETAPDMARGLRIGIISRRTEGEAWDVAARRFPKSPEGEAMRRFASKGSDSHWVKTLVNAPDRPQRETYWLGPFKSFQRACPYLVGSGEQVKVAITRYLSAGYRTFLIDAVASDEEARGVTDLFSEVANVATVPESKT
jgi:alkanesulfonate monooxygenase